MAKKKGLTVQDMEDLLLDLHICTEDFLDGAVCVGGYNRETMERVLEYYTAYRSFESFIEFELEED